MKIHSIMLENIGPFKGNCFKFTDGLSALCGINGSGKTTILEAIPLAFFGTTPSRMGSIYDRVTKGHKGKASISLDFSIGEDKYCINVEINTDRKIPITNYYLLDCKNNIVAGPKLSEYSAAIEKLIGDPSVFFASIFSSQKDYGDICSAKPADRKAIFASMLNLGLYDSIRTKLSDKLSSLGNAEKIRNTMAVYQDNASTALTQMAHLVMPERPACLADIDGMRGEEVALAESLASKMQDREIILKEQAVMERTGTDLNRQISEINASVTLLKNIPMVDACKSCSLVSGAIANNERLPALIAKRDDLRQQYASIVVPEIDGLSKLKALRCKIDNLVDMENRYNVAVAKHDADKASLTARLATCNEFIGKYTNELKVIEKEVEVYEILIDAFGKNGITQLVIDSAAGEFESIANTLLRSATAGKMSVAFATQKTLKDGTKAESMEIIVSNNGMSYDVSEYSGGEQKLIKTIIRLTLSLYMARKSERKLSCLFIDEIFDDLDMDNAENILTVLDDLTHHFEQIVIVSHSDELLTQVKNKIKL